MILVPATARVRQASNTEPPRPDHPLLPRAFVEVANGMMRACSENNSSGRIVTTCSHGGIAPEQAKSCTPPLRSSATQTHASQGSGREDPFAESGEPEPYTLDENYWPPPHQVPLLMAQHVVALSRRPTVAYAGRIIAP